MNSSGRRYFLFLKLMDFFGYKVCFLLYADEILGKDIFSS